jgi:hypothetical protein
MGLGDSPDANQEGSGDEQKEEEGFEAIFPIQEEPRKTSSNRNRE